MKRRDFLALTAAAGPAAAAEGWIHPFAQDGPPSGWLVREWFDVARPAEGDTGWRVRRGILQPGSRRGTWLLSPREYGDFIIELEIRLTERGNSGLALRAPLYGDPAFDGMELQFADLRYNPQAQESELTGGIYRAIAPRKQLYRPLEWNKCRVELKGTWLKAMLNGEVIHDLDLSTQNQPVNRHDGAAAPPVCRRPRRGRIGFQHLSRDNAPIWIRGVRLKEL